MRRTGETAPSDDDEGGNRARRLRRCRGTLYGLMTGRVRESGTRAKALEGDKSAWRVGCSESGGPGED